MKRFIKTCFKLAILAGVAFAIFFTVQGYQLYKEAKKTQDMTAIFSEIQHRPDFVKIDDLPELYIEAVVVVEDKRFYEHPGFDIWATLRALKNDVMHLSYVEGGSTITQQLAKNAFFTQEKTIPRKIAEVFMAFDIEKQYSKDEIFELYVNTIYFGENFTGIAQAAHGYYHVAPRELNEYQMTLLAGVPNAPSVYAPTVNPKLAHERQQQVIQKLVKNHRLTEKEAAAISNMAVASFINSLCAVQKV